MQPLAAIRDQAEACERLGSPMYAQLCARLADDLAEGGITAAIVAGRAWRGPDAVALRILGSVHRLVLERSAGALAAFYPSVGGRWDSERGWAAFRALLVEQSVTVRAGMDRPPQTNEIGRGAALVGGITRLAGEIGATDSVPVRLHEIGASAGLLLRADAVRYVGADGSAIGPADSPLAVSGAWADGKVWAPRFPTPNPWQDAPPPWQIAERRGCDLNPIDAGGPEGRLMLSAYCWPDQAIRWERLRGALQIARDLPVEIEQRDATDFVDDLRLGDGSLTVLWHSVMWQYLPPDAQERISARIEVLLRSATVRRPFAHLSLEPRREGRGHPFVVRLRAAWGSGGIETDLATTAPHGIPCVGVERTGSAGGGE